MRRRPVADFTTVRVNSMNQCALDDEPDQIDRGDVRNRAGEEQHHPERQRHDHLEGRGHVEEGQQHARIFEERAFEDFGFRLRLVEGRARRAWRAGT